MSLSSSTARTVVLSTGLEVESETQKLEAAHTMNEFITALKNARRSRTKQQDPVSIAFLWIAPGCILRSVAGPSLAPLMAASSVSAKVTVIRVQAGCHAQGKDKNGSWESH